MAEEAHSQAIDRVHHSCSVRNISQRLEHIGHTIYVLSIFTYSFLVNLLIVSAHTHTPLVDRLCKLTYLCTFTILLAY